MDLELEQNVAGALKGLMAVKRHQWRVDDHVSDPLHGIPQLLERGPGEAFHAALSMKEGGGLPATAKRLQELESSRDRWTVYVRTELVVEIAFDDIQASPQYPAGLALRFARVKRYRPDKSPQEADTLETVRAIFGGRLGRSNE